MCWHYLHCNHITYCGIPRQFHYEGSYFTVLGTCYLCHVLRREGGTGIIGKKTFQRKVVKTPSVGITAEGPSDGAVEAKKVLEDLEEEKHEGEGKEEVTEEEEEDDGGDYDWVPGW